MATPEASIESAEVVCELARYIDRAFEESGGATRAKKPQHRVKFHWPPHPISYSFHVLSTDWKGTATFEAYGETFTVQVARTPFGVFGRCPAIWHEERGDTEDEMLERLLQTSEPLFQRQLAISKTLEIEGRYRGNIASLGPLELVKLLYCEDRDVANEAKSCIEIRGSNRLFFPSLVHVLSDRKHPNRRSAQWCVLDLFEDLPSYCDSAEDEWQAVSAMKQMIWDAEDDYARTIYKAGVVLGGHIPYQYGGPILIDCLTAPSKIGRRAAIHGLFHVVEWMPDMHDRVISELNIVSTTDPEQILREYAGKIARDIGHGDSDHAPDPFFPDED